MRQMIVRIDDEVHERLRARARAEGRSMNSVVVEVLKPRHPTARRPRSPRARLAAEAMVYDPSAPASEVPSHEEVAAAERGSGTAVSEALAAERAAR